MKRLAAIVLICVISLCGCGLQTQSQPQPESEPSDSGKEPLVRNIVEEDGIYYDKNSETMFEDANGMMIDGADPDVLKDVDGTYYMYATGDSRSVNTLPAWKSTDLENWESVGSVISEHPYVDTGGVNDKEENRLFNYWSPDVYYLNGKYYLFVSGPVMPRLVDDYVKTQINISVYVAESDSPIGPFDRFVMVKPRNPELNAPRTVFNEDDIDNIYTDGYLNYMPIRIDFHLFDDPNSGKLYAVYTGYGDPSSEEENGNHDIIFELDDPEFSDGEDGNSPGFYYTYHPESVIHASNPLDWPEFEGKITTTMDKNGEVWRPDGYPFHGYVRGVTEAPSLGYQNGWYQLYFSVNTWDSPCYQIVCVQVKNLEDFEIEKRKSLSPEDKKICVFQQGEYNDISYINYGSGTVFQDDDGRQYYFMHMMPKGSVRKLGYKEIIW